VRSINVSGVVIDQFDHPLENIPVEYEVAHAAGKVGKVTRGTTTTDGQGRFEISGLEGAAISLVPRADGYLLIATNNRVSYSGFFKSDPLHYLVAGTNRVLRMWKRTKPEPLVRLSKSYSVPSTELPLGIDLQTGLVVAEGGDLVLRLEGTKDKDHAEQKAWILELSSKGGAVQLADRGRWQWTFEAPNEGYQESARMEIPQDGAGQRFSVDCQAFLRRGMLFSKVSVTVLVRPEDPKPFWVEIVSLSNPSGSGNWEEEGSLIKTIH